MKQKIFKIKNEIWNFIRKWKILLISALSTAVVMLMIIMLMSGQKDIGANQAGMEIAKLAQNIRNRYQTRPDYWGLSTSEVINKKIYPLSMKVEANNLIGYFNNEVLIGADETGAAVMPTFRKFAIAYNDLNEAQCIGLAANKFDKDFWLGVGGVKIANNAKNQLFDWSSKELVLPMGKNVAEKYCQRGNNSVIFYFE